MAQEDAESKAVTRRVTPEDAADAKGASPEDERPAAKGDDDDDDSKASDQEPSPEEAKNTRDLGLSSQWEWHHLCPKHMNLPLHLLWV